ncbi:MAG: hypothetical protein IPF92_04785 [Myxococcales bacterium]|jgi:predicted lipoprotein|nr:hypothetical protein [Myxococcales bacterium]MBL0197887.1 hypothetical protein [Myxococcales bacterium]
MTSLRHRLAARASRTLAVVGALHLAGLAGLAACHTTEDPRPGISKRGAQATPELPPPIDAGLTPDAAALPVGPLACGARPATTAPFSKRALLGAAADCAAWHACTFANAAHVLSLTVASDAKDATSESRALAQLAYRQAMAAWSGVELFQFGPVAEKVTDKYHGRGLRAYVHPWPDTSRCQVETQIAGRGYAQGFDLVFPSARGLFAIEYALHYPGRDTSCTPSSTGAAAWAALSPDALAKAKGDYAVAVARDVSTRAAALHAVWTPTGESFKAKLLAADGYGSEQEALNVVAWSLLYPELQVKDLKLGSYAGFQTAPPIPESPFARLDVENVRANLRGFRSLFMGCGPEGEGLGFDDWLVAVGDPGLARDLAAHFATALAAADAFPPFQQATEAQFVDFYLKVRPLANLLKTNFFGSASSLNLKLPASAASDTD